MAPQEGRPDQSSPYIQVLEEDWRQAQRDLQEQTRTVFSLRKDLRQAEAQRARVRGPRWGGGLASQRCVPPGPFLQARPGWPAGPAPSACSPGWVQGPGPGPGLAGLRAAGLAAVSPPQCLEEKEVFELQCLALRKDSKMYKDRIEAILRQMEEVAVERDQVAVRAEPLRGGGGQTGFTQRKQVTLYTRFSPKKERRSPVARQQVKDPALPLPWLR